MTDDAPGSSGQGSGHGSGHGSDAVRLVALLTVTGRTVAVAESLTGGAVSSALVAVPGASRCLRGGVVAYATDLKAELLGVPRELLARHGAVHPDVARAMALGVRERLGADYGLATTGVAGPEPQDGHPPGTFHVAVQGPDGGEVVSVLPGTLGRPGTPGTAGSADTAGTAGATPSRDAVRAAACDAVLALALRHAGDRAGAPG